MFLLDLSQFQSAVFRLDLSGQSLVLQRLIGYQTPGNLIQQIETGKKFVAVDISLNSREQQGWLDITYLDHNLRIGRGNEGSVFVLTKV